MNSGFTIVRLLLSLFESRFSMFGPLCDKNILQYYRPTVTIASHWSLTSYLIYLKVTNFFAGSKRFIFAQNHKILYSIIVFRLGTHPNAQLALRIVNPVTMMDVGSSTLSHCHAKSSSSALIRECWMLMLSMMLYTNNNYWSCTMVYKVASELQCMSLRGEVCHRFSLLTNLLV